MHIWWRLRVSIDKWNSWLHGIRFYINFWMHFCSFKAFYIIVSKLGNKWKNIVWCVYVFRKNENVPCNTPASHHFKIYECDYKGDITSVNYSKLDGVDNNLLNLVNCYLNKIQKYMYNIFRGEFELDLTLEDGITRLDCWVNTPGKDRGHYNWRLWVPKR